MCIEFIIYERWKYCYFCKVQAVASGCMSQLGPFKYVQMKQKAWKILNLEK